MLEHKNDHQCWQAGLDIQLVAMDGVTRLGRTRHYGPLRLQRPFWPEGRSLAHLYLLHPPGGLVAGDSLIQTISAGPGAAGLVTTPAAGKVYFNATGYEQRQVTTLQLGAGSSLEWLPQETILYNGANGVQETRVSIAGDGVFVGWDLVCLGRRARGERFESGSLRQCIAIDRDNCPLYRENLMFSAGDGIQSSIAGLNGQPVMGTFICVFPMGVAASLDCDVLHQSLLSMEGATDVVSTTLRNDCLITRYLGTSPEQARAAFSHVWAQVRPLLNGRPACYPRIWNT